MQVRRTCMCVNLMYATGYVDWLHRTALLLRQVIWIDEAVLHALLSRDYFQVG